MALDLLDWLGILVDSSIPFACLLDLFLIFVFLRGKHDLCPVFAWCLRNIFYSHLIIYFAEVFIHQFAANGLFLNFFKKYENIIGKIFFDVCVVWTSQVVIWNTIMAGSRLWCVVQTFGFYSTWDEKLQRKITIFVWGLNAALSAHIFIFVECQAWEMGPNSMSFGTKTPSFFDALYATYVPNISYTITLIIYVYLGYELYRLKAVSNRLARRTLVAQFLINLPKLFTILSTSYANAQFYLFPNLLPEMDLKLFWLLTQLGNTFYGINATIVIFTCFPNVC